MSRIGATVKWAGAVIALVVVASALVGFWAYSYGRSSVPPLPDPTIELEKLAQLATLKVNVVDVLEAKTGGDLTGVKGVWLIKGDALLAIDMNQARVVDKDAVKKTAVFLLPKPTVFHPRVDHSKTMTYDVRKGIFVFGTSEESRLRDQAMRQAQQLVEFAASSDDTVKVAREVAEKLIQGIYGMVGWTVEVRWADRAPGSAPK